MKNPMDMTPEEQADYLTKYLEIRYPKPGWSDWNEIAIEFITGALILMGGVHTALVYRYDVEPIMAYDVVQDLKQFHFMTEY